mmetsp:Transcript_254/g.574  ORF Transcript_254/g.574 Transcript_254/m.574 type:complete len:128 (+) Transcript_254:1187-1570(+)
MPNTGRPPKSMQARGPQLPLAFTIGIAATWSVTWFSASLWWRCPSSRKPANHTRKPEPSGASHDSSHISWHLKRWQCKPACSSRCDKDQLSFAWSGRPTCQGQTLAAPCCAPSDTDPYAPNRPQDNP